MSKLKDEYLLELFQRGDLNKIKTMLQDHKLAELLEVKDKWGSNGLNWASGKGQTEVLRYFKDTYKIDFSDYAGKDGRNVLHWAARNGHLETCKWLVKEGGMDPLCVTKDGTNALHWAVWKSQKDICQWLLDDCKMDVNSVNQYGCGAMQWLARTGNIDLAKYLLSQGLDINMTNNIKRNALHKAAHFKNGEFCNFVLENTNQPLKLLEQVDSGGYLPIWFAETNSDKELVSFFNKTQEKLSTSPKTSRQTQSFSQTSILPFVYFFGILVLKRTLID